MTVIEAVSLTGSAVAILSLILTLLFVSGRLGRMAGTFETGLVNQGKIITELKNEMVELRRVVTQVAVFNNQLSTQGQQLTMLSKRVDELAHGEGFVVPYDRIRAMGSP